MKCNILRADLAQHYQERKFRKAQLFEKNHQNFLSSTKCYFTFAIQSHVTLRPRTQMRANTSYCNIDARQVATGMLHESEETSTHQQALLKHL